MSIRTAVPRTLPKRSAAARPRAGWVRSAIDAVQSAHGALARIPYGAIALLARFSIAAVFWSSGQTKVEGFALNLVTGEFAPGWPRLSDNALALFEHEYALPLLAPAVAASMAAAAEHLFPALLLLGLATRASALALLGMTAVIQFLVYPGAWATHGTWAAVLLVLVWRGAGVLSLDHLLAGRAAAPRVERG